MNATAALDAAVDQFWRHGFAGTDLDSIATGAGGTKPSLYELFGDKRSLFRSALERYGATIGSAPVMAFSAASDVESAVQAFLRTAIIGQTDAGRPSGCLLACVGATEAECDPATRELLAAGTVQAETAVTQRFEEAARSGELPASFPAQIRARLLVDLMQASALRARSGAPRDALLAHIADQTLMVLADVASARNGRTAASSASGASSGT